MDTSVTPPSEPSPLTRRSQSEQLLEDAATRPGGLLLSKSESALHRKSEEQEQEQELEMEQEMELDATDTSRDEELLEEEAAAEAEPVEAGESDAVAVHLQQLEQTHDHLEEASRAASCSSLSSSSGAGSASSAASLTRRASAHARLNNPLRGDTNLKIFLPSDNVALKAILSPRHSAESEAERDDSKPEGASANLLDKLLFRNAPVTPKKSMGSVVEEDLEAASVVVMNTNLPPPPFANMYACESCREDIGSLLSKGRHHCRNCGGSFCSDCTTRTIIVPYQAYLTRGELRVCDGCYHRIQNFQKQVKSTSVTWSGLQPPTSEEIVRDFELSDDESLVSIFNCALFLETTPYYGHLVLTRKRLCFQSYVDSKKRKVSYSQILSLLKPQFYYINGLQVKTKRKETFFLAEFNGLRDTCFLRLDQLIRAYQEASKLKGAGPGKSPSSKELRKQALDRRRSYKLISEHIVSSVGSTSSTGNPPLSSSSPISTVGFIDVDEDEDANAETPLSDIVEEGVHTDDGKSTASDEDPFEPLPPDPLLEKMTVLLDCDLRADVKRVFDLLWNDGPGQEFSHTNMEKARDIDIDIESWKAIDRNDITKAEEIRKGFEISKEDDYTLYRIVRSQHPPKTSFPGLPPYAGCTRTQRFRLDKSSNGGDKWDRFVITELNRMSKIPFSDYFEVEMRYVFSRDGNNYCHVQVGLVVNFLKATWFKSQINSSTRSESKEALEAWAKQAIEFLESQRNRVVPLSPTLRALSASGSFSELESEPGSSIHPVLKRRASAATLNRSVALARIATLWAHATAWASGTNAAAH
ncbi:Hepatocyte growth factor-regulated tyrosine kinase substrate [Phytophthora cinnamomi]|uniref:Hepatocyte growth factor-regulated tyrosine kinase substrate n=1 Tax=Phytophthora cinnamomi TaxID=4785 RepID=UPI00355A2856|nr:Hepatocyte growth factor-regulated tyrosine kinase substrate [Phytophthora cinnamomi]